jgi:UDP:flavonoid glycosyltransferase YjiC (YdhE family)
LSRFLFATAGSLGDLHPYVAVARALIQRGHQAVIAAAEDHRVPVEAAGVEFAPVRPRASDIGDYQDLVTRLFDTRRGPERLMREFVMPYLRPAYEDLSRAVDRADLLISHPLTVTLPLVAELRGLPWVATVLSPLSFMSSYDPPVLAGAPWFRKLRALGPGPYGVFLRLAKLVVRSWEAPLRDFRRELGLPPSKHLAMFEGQFSPLRNLALFDPQLAAPQPDWPDNVRVCGAPIYDGPAPDAGIRDDLERFLGAGEPPIVFALGSSAVWIAGDFWDMAAAAARQLGRRAVLVTGPVTPAGLPGGVRAFPYLPYSSAFPRAAAVVHQAGIGTLAQALRAGRPQLIVPVAFDQPDNARRAAALGLARVLPFRKVTARRLASELAALLDRPSYPHEARAVAEALTGVDGAARAAEALIACAQPLAARSRSATAPRSMT